jgi:prepilin-type N-terminal cleavage/methylation domain-containing protein
MSSKHTFGRSKGFTLIEIMVVVAILGIVLATGIPPMARMIQREGISKAINDVFDACQEARAQAVLGQGKVELVIHPLDGSIEVGKFTGQIPKNVSIIMVGVNFIDFTQSEEARVGFYPNGTSDEFSLTIQGEKGEIQEIYLDIITGTPEIRDKK